MTEPDKYHELKFSREQGFFDRSPSIRMAIGLIFTLCLFLFLHFREVRVEIPELNSVAPGYTVAQVDFDFLDEEATSILKQESVRDIGKIYKISDKEIRQRRMAFENFLIYNQEWRKYVRESTFDEMYKGADLLEKALLQLRFTDARTLQKMKEVGLSTSNYQIYTPSEVGEGTFLPTSTWKHLKSTVLSGSKFQPTSRDFVIGYFQNNTLTLEEDIPAEKQLRRTIQLNVEDKYSHVSAGSRIVDQGDRISARQVAMLQAMKEALGQSRNLWHPLTLAGSMILAILLTVICVAYLKTNHPQVLVSNRKLCLIVFVMLLTMGMAKMTEFLIIASKGHAVDVVRYPVFIPFAAILLCSLMNPGIATFASGFLALILTLGLSFELRGFMVINLAAGLVAILNTHSLRQRKEIFVVCFKAWLSCILVIFAINFSQNILWSVGILEDILVAAICLLLTSIIVVGLLPLLESLFRVMTDVSLSEYLDPNNDLLRKLTIEAPGTYQHSVVVGNIAEIAAVAIGANGLFCRVATLYHDVGKMATPQYFTENQQDGMNIHQLLTPQESAEVIMAHVSEGVAIARKSGLPEQFIDVIKEHHGTTLVYYFYRKQLEKMHGDASKVDEKAFRYSGPKPRSKESAIIMIADTLEAASRSLEKVNEDTLTVLANRLIREKAEDGQFDQCMLTLEELSIVKATLVKTLVAFSHSRIKYPNREMKHKGTFFSSAPSFEA